MSGEKRHWQLSTPFQRFPGKQDLRLKARVGHSESRLSSVYLFDDPVQAQRTTHKESNHTPHLPKSPAVTPLHPFSPNDVDNDPYDPELISSQYTSYLEGGSCDTAIVNTSPNDDLTQRLGSAYEHIRSMPSAASPKVLLSSDPQMLRKQLGVPQHSVLNYPIHSSPDLPNPHTSPCELASPRLPSTTPPDVSYARTSKNLDLRTNTTIYPPSPRHCSPDPMKAAKCRVEKPIIPPSSLPSTNARRRQISLPQIRSPSPFRVDIPLHHTWHDRRTDFNSSATYETKSRRTSGSTELLASLAWIGSSSTTSPYTDNRRHQLASPSFLPDRFGATIAIEDDSISDDVLVDRLEKVRGIDGPSERARDFSPSRFSDHVHFPSVRGDENRPLHKSCQSPSLPNPDQLTIPRDVLPSSSLIPKDTFSDSEDAAIWQAARKALLCIREIIRTEKRYQEALKMLLNAQTATPPPPSMAPYVSALVRASEMLLKCFLEDPSAWGVSTAFVASEDELEATMVSWCAVAGAFFTDENDPRSRGLTGRWRLRKSGMVSSPSSSVTKQASISFNSQLPSMPSIDNTNSKIKEQMDEDHRNGQYSQIGQEKQTTCVSLKKLESTNSRAPAGQPPSRKLSVRDLAIQPIQRVMRYVLLYRDLLDCTPSTSPSHLLVERALEAASRIANYCNRAQRNPAFLHAS